MLYKFSAYGHPSILGTHKTTLEFTKDEELTLRGDCIVGVKADFEQNKLNEIIKNSIKRNIKITIEPLSNEKHKKIKETIYAQVNPSFNDNAEFVIRKTNFVSERTFAIHSNKAAFDLNRDLINFLKGENNKISVIIENNEK